MGKANENVSSLEWSLDVVDSDKKKKKNSFYNTAKNIERTMKDTLNMTFINIRTR